MKQVVENGVVFVAVVLFAVYCYVAVYPILENSANEQNICEIQKSWPIWFGAL